MSEENSEFLCPECGGPTEILRARRTIETRCIQCGWSVVTCYTPPIENDMTEYAVHVLSGNFRDGEHVRLVAKLTGSNFLQARDLLQRKDAIVFRGKALEVLRVKESLTRANLRIFIEPKFDWE